MDHRTQYVIIVPKWENKQKYMNMNSKEFGTLVNIMPSKVQNSCLSGCRAEIIRQTDSLIHE